MDFQKRKCLFFLLALTSSLCCYSQAFAANAVVTNTNDSGAGSLRNAIATANAGGGMITFSLPSGSTIQLLSSLPVLSPTAGTITINDTSVPININGNGNQCFFANTGTIVINNINISGAKAAGGSGGSNPGGTGAGGGGGGGGMGAGGGLFVNSGANVTISDVTFHGSQAIGGSGGNGGLANVFGGAGGGGGGLNQVSSGNANGGVGGMATNSAASGGGGGGGGANQNPIAQAGVNGPGGTQGANGGNGAGPGSGPGGVGTSGGSGGSGAAASMPFSGGGGGAGNGGSFQGGFGGAGADFGGGAGGGSGSAIPFPGTAFGGVGGFGGGGGGGGCGNPDPNNPSVGSAYGGNGGFGSGAGGGGNSTVIPTPGFGGGGSAPGGSINGGGGGGAGLGGAVFVRQGGTLLIEYFATNMMPISGNLVAGGFGGNGAGSGNPSGRTYGPDIFLSSGGALNFTVDTPVIISSNIDADGLAGGGGLEVKGSSSLTLTGNNTYTGGTTIDAGGTLAVQSDSSLGATGNGVAFNPGTLQFVPGSSFSTNRTFTLNVFGNLVNQSANVATLNGLITGSGILSASGPGVIHLTAINNYSGGTIFSNGIVQISSPANLGTGALNFSGGTLELLNAFGTQTLTLPILLSSTGTIQADPSVIATISNGISGTGSIAINGGGTVIFSGTNTYGGSTSIGNNTTLQINTNTSLPSGTSIVDNGLLFIDHAGSETISGNISASGSLSVDGGGTLILSGMNTYGGSTNIGTGSTLQINSSQSLPTATNVTDNGILIFNHAGTETLSGGISGSGSVIVEGGGTVALTGFNSYSGGTTVSPATLQINNSLSLGTGPLTLGPTGTLQLLPAVQFLDNPIILNSPAQIQNDGLWIITNTISGTGPLTFSGGGTLALEGNNTYTGGTTVSGGIVFVDGSIIGPTTVDPGAVFGGSGVVGGITNNGTVFPINTFTAIGNYTQSSGGALNIDIDGAGTNSQLSITGQATLSGILNVSADGAFFAGETFTILTATNGVTPAFTTLNFPSFLQLAITYNPNDVVLTILQQSILPFAHVNHYNPRHVLNYIQAIEYTSATGLIQLINVMDDLDSCCLTKALDQLHPAVFGDFDLLNLNTSTLIASFFSRHMAEICCMHLQENCGCNNASVWVQPFGYFYNQDQIGEQVGFHSDTAGVAAGIDYCFANGILVGIGGAYSTSDIHWKQRRGHGSVEGGYFALYSDWIQGPIYLEAALMGSIDSFHGTRHIQFSTIDRNAKHHKGGYDFTAHLGGGGDVKLPNEYYLKPFAKVDYVYLYQKGFSEHGAGDIDLFVHGRHANMLRSELGVNFTRSFHLGKEECFAPTIWLSGINESYLRKRHYHCGFVGQSLEFKIRSFSKPIFLISPGIDLSCVFRNDISLGLRYAVELNGDITTQKLDGRFEWRF